MGIKGLTIKHSYTGKGKDILDSFLLPALSESIAYDRITGYFSIESLLAISQGIDSLFEKSGKMRLIVGIHSVPMELIDAIENKDFLSNQVEQIREEIKKGILSISDALEKRRIATIAWMVEDGLLDIKAASVGGEGIFHPKTLILKDSNGDSVVAIGSPNETGSGLGSNFEQLMVAKSWEAQDAVDDQQHFFDSLWFNKVEGVYCFDISEFAAKTIKESLGDGFDNPHKQIKNIVQTIEEAKKMPTYFFTSGDIPALYMHQERAVIDALSRWPVRVLFSDEVGLGKTFEAASTMVFLIKYCGVKKVIVLTPKSVLNQWQEELYEHFGLCMWLYNSSKKEYVAPDGRTIQMQGKNPLGADSPDMILMSAQFARGSGNNGSLFEKDDSVLPDLLVVDEAHSARIRRDITGGKTKTRMYKMLEKISTKISHVIFATATPMQTDSEEYHALLNLLGLPKLWQKERSFLTSLRIIGSSEALDISDANTAAKLLCSIIDNMHPLVLSLVPEEKTLIDDLKVLMASADSYDVGLFVIENWSAIRKVFVRLHPARLLTVRNTRRALSDVGYQFPKRNLMEISVTSTNQIQLFYQKVNDYISYDCFSIERALEPDKTINLGFIRVNYQQRVASSLYSCRESLKRRYNKALILRNYLLNNGIIKNFQINILDINESLDDIEIDELFSIGDENIDLPINWDIIDVKELKRAVSIECTSLGSLLDEADSLLKTVGDAKIIQSIQIAINCIEKGDTVLLFSRYTDTVDALIERFKEEVTDFSYPYGVYTGQKSIIVKDGIEELCGKERIKRELFESNIKIMFCSDAASEGLNLQAARVLINVDVPWTPSRLEQRIGRIARLGQKAKEVDIYNVWYPNSIEARMYHRIQRRLDETNLAIGEFPDVVANTIKEAVLEDSDKDDSIKQLNDLRNSYQMRALEELWTEGSTNSTVSSIIRKKLIELGKSRFKAINQTNEMLTSFEMPDGSIIDVSEESGISESISLSSKLWNYTDFAIPNITVKKSNDGFPVLFYSPNLRCLIKPESIFDLAFGETIEPSMAINDMPIILPNNRALTTGYILDCNIPKAPEFWPPVVEV